MDQDTTRIVVEGLARSIVERVAPDELAGFRTQAKAWFDDPERARRGDSARSDPLGLGLEAELLNHTPLALYIVQHVVSAGTGIVFSAVGRKTGRWLLGKRHRDAAEVAANAETSFDASTIVKAYDGNFDRIRETAVNAAIKYGADAELAELLADVLVTVLAEALVEQPPAASAQE